jgi:uncharacterized delta-60 repeat protein
LGERPEKRRHWPCAGAVGFLSALIGLAGLAVLAVASPAQAAPGDLDGSFSRDGRVLTDIGGDDKATAIAIQPDGRIVVAGFSSPPGGTRRFALVRYEPNGDRDPAFGSDGIVTTRFGDESAAQALAIQPDGRIVVAGMASHPERGWDFALARYNPNGSLDTTFSGDGRLTTDFDGGADAAHALALQPDGRIVLGGESKGDFAAARYQPGGQLDSSFGGDGLVRTDFTGGGDGAHALALHPNGKLALAGYATEPGDIDSWVPAVARYESDGDLDPSFSGDGRRTVDSLASVLHGNAAYGLVARQNGGVVLAGGWGLLAFAADGSLDSAFGDAGRGLGLGGLDSVRGLVAQPDGWLIAVGSSDPFSGDFEVSHWSPDGFLDSAFGDVSSSEASSSSDGALTDFGLFRNDEARAAAIQPDGRIVVAGASLPGYEEPPADFAVARYRVDLSPPDDVDADGVTDARDLCPRRYTSHEPDGCPHYPRAVTIRYSNRSHAFKGRVVTPQPRCAGYYTRVDIFKQRRGHDVRIGYGFAPHYTVRWPRHPGRYYAKLRDDSRFFALLGICEAARSRLVRVTR